MSKFISSVLVFLMSIGSLFSQVNQTQSKEEVVNQEVLKASANLMIFSSALTAKGWSLSTVSDEIKREALAKRMGLAVGSYSTKTLFYESLIYTDDSSMSLSAPTPTLDLILSSMETIDNFLMQVGNGSLESIASFEGAVESSIYAVQNPINYLAELNVVAETIVGISVFASLIASSAASSYLLVRSSENQILDHEQIAKILGYNKNVEERISKAVDSLATVYGFSSEEKAKVKEAISTDLIIAFRKSEGKQENFKFNALDSIEKLNILDTETITSARALSRLASGENSLPTKVDNKSLQKNITTLNNLLAILDIQAKNEKIDAETKKEIQKRIKFAEDKIEFAKLVLKK